jgi:hypothetical protein
MSLITDNYSKKDNNSTKDLLNAINTISNQLLFTNVMMVGLFGLSIVKPFIISYLRISFITELLNSMKETLPDKITILVPNK